MHLDAKTAVVEVVFAWRDEDDAPQVLEVVQIERTSDALWIGARNAGLLLPTELCAAFGVDERFCLLQRAGDGFEIALPPGAQCATHEGLSRWALVDTAEVRLGRFSFFVRPSEAAKPLDRGAFLDGGAFLDASTLRCIAAVSAIHAAFLALSFFAPPNAAALQLDRDEGRMRFVAALLTQPEFVQEEEDDHFGSAPRDREASTAPVTGSVSVSGGPGRDGAAQQGRHRTNVPLTQEQVRDSGVLRQLSGSLANIMGDEWSALGNPDRANGPGGAGLQTLAAGDFGTGFGGLQMNGHGRGSCVGEHCGEDTISHGGTGRGGVCGCGDMGKLGHGIGMAGIGTMGNGTGQRQRLRNSHVPQIRTASVTASGGLSSEEIRRTVRRHINEVRSCYEDESARNPQLEGRVSIRLMISAEGTVQTSEVASGANALTEVGTCIAQATRRWSFPRSNGPTLVSYPFILADMN